MFGRSKDEREKIDRYMMVISIHLRDVVKYSIVNIWSHKEWGEKLCPTGSKRLKKKCWNSFGIRKVRDVSAVWSGGGLACEGRKVNDERGWRPERGSWHSTGNGETESSLAVSAFVAFVPLPCEFFLLWPFYFLQAPLLPGIVKADGRLVWLRNESWLTKDWALIQRPGNGKSYGLFKKRKSWVVIPEPVA